MDKILPRFIGLIFMLLGLTFIKTGHEAIFCVVGIFFTTVGTYAFVMGIVPDKKFKRQQSPEEREAAIRKAGEEGEKRVEYALNWLGSGYKVLNDVNLSIGGHRQQFDHIVIGENGIFNMETKNYSGTIHIDEAGNWSRDKHGTREGMVNPLAQSQRHRKVLEEILGTQCPIVDLIVISNDATIIEGSKNSKIPVVKYDSLQYYIENCRLQDGCSKINVSDVERMLTECMVEGYDYSNGNPAKLNRRSVGKSFGMSRIVLSIIAALIIIVNLSQASPFGRTKDKLQQRTMADSSDAGKNKAADSGKTDQGQGNKAPQDNKNAVSSKKVEEKDLQATAINGQVILKVNSVESSSDGIVINATMTNNTKKEITRHVSEYFLVDGDKKSYQLDFFENTDFNKTLPPDSKDDVKLVFKNINMKAKPFKLIGKVFIMDPQIGDDKRTLQMTIE